MRVLCIAGARPNFMKVAPILAELRRTSGFAASLIHTGQHYDDEMSSAFFQDLEIPCPDINLGVGSGTNTWQTAQVMLALDPILVEDPPDLMVVVGDVNSTLAAALAAARHQIPVAHVEAGLRSFDPSMPEELNRRLTDAVSDLAFITSRDAAENLRREGIGEERIHFVGNVMAQTLLAHRKRSAASSIRADLGLPARYALVTLHRPSNVDDPGTLGLMSGVLCDLAASVGVVFPVHPRTRERLSRTGLGAQLASAGVRVTDPAGYLDFLHLMEHAALVVTDSGGIQEETTVLGVPCLTVRSSTERPVTITEGTNTLVGSDPARILAEAAKVLDGHGKAGRVPELWDEDVSKRIVGVIGGFLDGRRA